MRVKHIPCGPYANDSEAKSVAYLKSKLEGCSGDGLWILLSNLPFAVNNAGSSSEIDIVAIGPSGIHVIETKHWNFKYVDAPDNNFVIEQEAEKLQRKTRIIATTLRQSVNIGYLSGKFLLTRSDDPKYSAKTDVVRGAKIFPLKDWNTLLDVSGRIEFNIQQIEKVALLLEPRIKPALTGDIRTFGSYINLERIGDKSDSFRRLYKGVHAKNRDKVLLYVYDYSASDTSSCDTIARREFETIRKLQKSPWLPRLVESFQDASEYPGELFFFSVADPSAPTLEQRAEDKTWSAAERLECALQTLTALDELHHPKDEDIPPVVHRNLSPSSIYIRSSQRPLFGGLRYTKLEGASTIAGAPYKPDGDLRWVAPEVLKHGLEAADKPSDVFSACTALLEIIDDESIKGVLQRGASTERDKRPAIKELVADLETLIPHKQPATQSSATKDGNNLPDARYWDEDLEIPFRDCLYRVINRLGSGGWGTTFKVLQVDPETREELGTYVAKTINSAESGKCAIDAYRKARAVCVHTHLAAIYEVSTEWHGNQITALMNWVEGLSLGDLAGVLELYAEDVHEDTVEELVLRWTRQLCEALKKIHQSGFVHGDVTPKNIIVSDAGAVLTDYDLFTVKGHHAMSAGTIAYCSPQMENRAPIFPGDDIFSLAASFFHSIFDRAPFDFDGTRRKDRGCNWVGVDVGSFSKLHRFISKATDPNIDNRFDSASQALSYLESLDAPDAAGHGDAGPKDDPLERAEVPWLLEVLRSYPGSEYGNTETRGLDSEFAVQTYVPTDLDRLLLQQIVDRRVKLVVLTGNAGDGKTAFLQNLAKNLGLNADKSAKRVIDETLANGLTVKVNLDGSASFKERSSTQLLDNLFGPFLATGDHVPHSSIVHLLAVNSGPLLSWIEQCEARLGDSAFLRLLRSVVEEDAEAPSWLAYVDFNQRSLVGGLDERSKQPSSEFLERLIESMLGGERVSEIWAPCHSCVSQSKCPVADNVSRLRGIDSYSPSDSKLFRERLFSALRAVHQRAEVHITARELRAALTYIIFGTKWCQDIHDTEQRAFHSVGDLAFDPMSALRQGLLLGELTKLDPGLETHPIVDRFLERIERERCSANNHRATGRSLAELRRDAFFELDDRTLSTVFDEPSALGLAGGKHFQLFLRYPVMDVTEKEQVLHSLCYGLSRLVDIPLVALNKGKYVPLRVNQRTPTETTFWIEKPYARFSLTPDAQRLQPGLETLHTHLVLSYAYESGDKELLEISANLFGVLMELSDGFQLAGSVLDETFANLAIFCERLAQEDQQYLLAWHPSNDNAVYRISHELVAGKRMMKIEAVTEDEPLSNTKVSEANR